MVDFPCSFKAGWCLNRGDDKKERANLSQEIHKSDLHVHSTRCGKCGGMVGMSRRNV